MAKKNLVWGMLAALTFALVFMGCGDDEEDLDPPVPSEQLVALLGKYMGHEVQQWGDNEVAVYHLDASHFEAFKSELEALAEYEPAEHDHSWTESDRDWNRGKTFAQWSASPDGIFELRLDKADNSTSGYRYRRHEVTDVSTEGEMEVFTEGETGTSTEGETEVSPELKELLRKYMGAIPQTWGDDNNRENVNVYILNPLEFEAFRAELNAEGEYLQTSDYTEENRDWDRGKEFAQWIARATQAGGRFELRLCRADNSVTGYRYRVSL